ncbi:hypothetical protein [Abyssalbus ytuae]|uniref:DinB family protein n=1 Tax=Abyssalbus ytuae TaxID=2926907 RepID=A0A9E6ZLJ4_9FLAO|nr:hypothetical protein [Abyssalbus ytuae]UOB16834.1 hypothetical protein MQE35_13950 [Abyssalbus ytuae]
MKKLISLLLLFTFTHIMMAQEKGKTPGLPYYEIPEAAGEYTAGSVASRMIDGLGFRYRWATENLREEDLQYQPGDNARSVLQTIDHILNLSRIILNTALKEPTDFTRKPPVLTYEEKRKETLENLMKASGVLRKEVNLEEFKIQLVLPGGTTEYPFWNNINGPIADAIWHSGQIASFRRSSGNSISPDVQFLQGTIKNKP